MADLAKMLKGKNEAWFLRKSKTADTHRKETKPLKRRMASKVALKPH